MKQARQDFINIGYWICMMKIYYIGTDCCGGASELARHFGQNSPHKIRLHTNPLIFFVASAFSMARYRDPVFHPFVCPFCPFCSTFVSALMFNLFPKDYTVMILGISLHLDSSIHI